jgi:hypothetical protein
MNEVSTMAIPERALYVCPICGGITADDSRPCVNFHGDAEHRPRVKYVPAPSTTRGAVADRREYARAIWLAMVNDEAPNDETLEREGYFDAADAVIALSTTRGAASGALDEEEPK